MVLTSQIPTVDFVNLGCSRAVIDCQRIITQIVSAGYDISSDSCNQPHVIVVYCCGSIKAHRRELQTIFADAPTNANIIVLGKILPEQKNNFPKAFTFVPHEDEHLLIPLIRDILPIETANQHSFAEITAENESSEKSLLYKFDIKLTPAHYAYLPLSSPTFHQCPEHGDRAVDNVSVHPNAEIIAYAEHLVKSGVHELLLIAPANKTVDDIESLCQQLARLNIWVRINDVFSLQGLDSIVPLMKHGDVLPSLRVDVYEGKDCLPLLAKLEKWRAIIPHLAVHTRIFIDEQSSENSAAFRRLLCNIAAVDSYHCEFFLFKSNDLYVEKSNQIHSSIMAKIGQLTALQARIKKRQQEERLGAIEPLIIDYTIDDEDVSNIALARSIYDAPDSGGVVQLEDIYGAELGQIVHAELIEAVEENFIAIPA